MKQLISLSKKYRQRAHARTHTHTLRTPNREKRAWFSSFAHSLASKYMNWCADVNKKKVIGQYTKQYEMEFIDFLFMLMIFNPPVTEQTQTKSKKQIKI